jgi:hypothetical protein
MDVEQLEIELENYLRKRMYLLRCKKLRIYMISIRMDV